MIHLHNTGSTDEEYGRRLFKFASKLVKAGKLDDGEEQRVIQLSIEWPIDIQIDSFPENPVPENEDNADTAKVEGIQLVDVKDVSDDENDDDDKGGNVPILSGR